MNKKEIIDLYLEKMALKETVYQLSTGDKRMDTCLNELCKGLENKIDEIDAKLMQDPISTAEAMLEIREKESMQKLYPEIFFHSEEAKKEYIRDMKSLGFEEIGCGPSINMEDVKKRRFNLK